MVAPAGDGIDCDAGAPNDDAGVTVAALGDDYDACDVCDDCVYATAISLLIHIAGYRKYYCCYCCGCYPYQRGNRVCRYYCSLTHSIIEIIWFVWDRH